MTLEDVIAYVHTGKVLHLCTFLSMVRTPESRLLKSIEEKLRKHLVDIPLFKDDFKWAAGKQKINSFMKEIKKENRNLRISK